MPLFRRSARALLSGVPRQAHDAGARAPHLQICAHTDDDLYFMSPDLLQSIRAGIPVVSVYLTTGESDGINLAMDAPERPAAQPDFAGYSAARQHGICAAYAAMVTGDRRARWTRGTLRVRERVVAEINTLDGADVTLIFLNLRSCVSLPDQKLFNLWWQEKITKLGTLRPAGSPIPERADGRALTRDGVIGTLVDILREYEPAVVRIMNPDPERKRYNEHDDSVDYCDNTDHTAAAFFAMAALREYERGDPSRLPVVESYVGYCNQHLVDNLSAGAAAEKFEYLAVYGGEDGHECQMEPGA
ncbi:PIG-L family deacetylase [Streptomyces sp. NPDC050516]|uniref:PIG-L family deacetylase n=1 Tax=Streptomyces sp. NPDC050516 TaxID=3365621 RepID=UPI0037A15A78